VAIGWNNVILVCSRNLKLNTAVLDDFLISSSLGYEVHKISTEKGITNYRYLSHCNWILTCKNRPTLKCNTSAIGPHSTSLIRLL